ncbi:MAG: helix-turn-helix transcriptional regulator [Coxiellaceae bacterium]|nr:helix-turn-helix transcriptional regulator [Coxiellaceae bacterium]
MAENIPEEIALHIARRMTAVRLQKTWTREELARRSDVNVHTLKRFERTGQISLPRLIALCESLNMLEELIRAFKPRQRVSVDDWQVQQRKTRQRGRRSETES